MKSPFLPVSFLILQVAVARRNGARLNELLPGVDRSMKSRHIQLGVSFKYYRLSASRIASTLAFASCSLCGTPLSILYRSMENTAP
jgi:hypothetical protein